VHIQKPFYVSQDDKLVVSSIDFSDLTPIVIGVRLLRDDGTLEIMQYSHIPSGDRTRRTTEYPLNKGYLLSVTASLLGATTKRGEAFVQVYLFYGLVASNLATALLISDYVDGTFSPSWPSGVVRNSLDGMGMLKRFAGTNPAAGVEIVVTVPTGAYWRIISFRAQLVTDATVATRQVHLLFDDGATTLFFRPAQTTQIASLTRNYDALSMGYEAVAVLPQIAIELPPNLILPAGYRIQTATDNFAAGDNWGSPQLFIEEWLEL